MNTLRCLQLLWSLGGLALVLPSLRETVVRPGAIVRLLDSSTSWWTGGFEPDSPYFSTTQGALPEGVATLGSSIGGDAWQGRAVTVWTPLSGQAVRVCVAGYPHRPDCTLRAEFRHRDGRLTQRACSIADPHETWLPWDIHPPDDAIALRLVAEDRSSEPGGWLAFSEPFEPAPAFASAFFQAAQIATTLALTLTLLWLPGILLSSRIAASDMRALALLGTGPLLLAFLGLLVWTFDGEINATTLGVAFVATTWLALGAGLWRRNETLDTLDPATARILAVTALVALAAVARASFSGGPDGELYAGTIYRSLAVGDRSDSRIPFHVVQAAAHHLAPTSAETERFFTPWTFFSRGPLAGLVALPITLATAGMPPRDWAAYAWQPFDATGFAAYRIVLIALASSVIVALFAALAPLVGSCWALIAGGLLALSPFGVHDILFTWPKWEATTWILLSFLLAHQRHPAIAGVALAIGFLFHPMSALWAPWLALWAAGRHWTAVSPGSVHHPTAAPRRFTLAGVRFTVAMAALVLPWMAFGAFSPHLPESTHAGQGGFIEYFRLAEYQPATWANWSRTRWNNFANTFVPLWLFGVNREHSTLSDLFAPSGLLVRFAFSWWNTLPFGAGLALWAVATTTLFIGARRFATAMFLFVIGPALLLTAYWGGPSTGLMRECGHPLLAAVIGLTCVALGCSSRGNERHRTTDRLAALLAHRAIPWLQLPETFLMLWLTTLLNPRQVGADPSNLDPLYFAINIAALAAAAWLLARGRRGDAQPDPTCP